MALSKVNRRIRLKKGIRKKISGTADRPRLSVFKSNKRIYGQLIDDIAGHTLASVSSQETGKDGINIEISKETGQKLAAKAKEVGIENVIFDRNGYPYHGKVKSFADGAREGGLKF